jgi:hypothetical protein
MDFDIHQLDRVEPGSDKAEQALGKYRDALIGRFIDSPEGRARSGVDSELGFWVAQFIYYGWGYVGVSLPRMTVKDVEEIVTELFPRKISLSSPEDADAAIPELTLLWKYLKREYKLPQAESVLRFLQKIEPEFKSLMNDPARFGMAKSFFMMGQSAGFDMTKQEDMDSFVRLYNAGLALEQEAPKEPSPGFRDAVRTQKTTSTRKKAERKSVRIPKPLERWGKRSGSRGKSSCWS